MLPADLRSFRAWPWVLGAALFPHQRAVVLPGTFLTNTRRFSLRRARRLRVILANVLYENKRYSPFKRRGERGKADIISHRRSPKNGSTRCNSARDIPHIEAVQPTPWRWNRPLQPFPFLQCEVIALGLTSAPASRRATNSTERSFPLTLSIRPVRRDTSATHRQLAEASVD